MAYFTTKVWLGTENQVKAGILGNVELIVWDREGGRQLLSGRRIDVRRNSEGNLWVAWPNRTYTNKDGEEKRQFYIFPGPDSQEVRDQLNGFIIEKFREKVLAEGKTDLLDGQEASPRQPQETQEEAQTRLW